MSGKVPSTANNISAADELEKLAVLLDKGLLTREEFDTRKKLILGATDVRTSFHPVIPPPILSLKPTPFPSMSPKAPHQTSTKNTPIANGWRHWAFLGAAGAVGIVALIKTSGAPSTQGHPAAPSSALFQAPYDNQNLTALAPAPRQTVPPTPALVQAPLRVTRTLQGANLRSLAGMEGTVVRQVPANATLNVLETSGQWLRVSYEGSTGWIFRSLVQN